MNYSLYAFLLLIRGKAKFGIKIKQIAVVLCWLQNPVRGKDVERENDFWKFAGFVHIGDAYGEKLKVVTYHSLILEF